MKKIVAVLCFISLLFSPGISVAEELLKTDPFYTDIENRILAPFFNALKDGNVDVIKQYISRDMYRKNRRLLDQNKKYPEFLRKYYQGASFRMERTKKMDSHVVIDVMIEFPNGYRRVNKLRVFKKRSELQDRNRNNSWRISEQALDRTNYSSENVSSVE